MEHGIDAATQRWTGTLEKRDFLHKPDQQTALIQTISVQYQELSFEHATKTYHWREHLHDNTEIIFVKRGVYIGRINGHELTLPANHVMIVGPGNRHSDMCQPPLEYYAVRFDIRQVTDDSPIHLLRDNLAPDRYRQGITNKSVMKTLDALVLAEQQNARFAFPLQQALAQELLWHLLCNLPEDILNPMFLKHTQQSELLIRLTRLFEARGNSTLRVIDMAEALNMSESALAHACTDMLGISPGKALTRFRMHKALQLLRHTNLSVKEIAARLGFHDESHFIHAFRKEQNCTPGLFRTDQPKVIS